ncbi:hypothetical protein ACQY0O_005669 [Thecaphora frezii]
MAAPVNSYFDAASRLSDVDDGGCSQQTSASVSPNVTALLSPSSCSTAVSHLSLHFDESRSRSPSTSACTSISDASSDVASLDHPSKPSPASKLRKHQQKTYPHDAQQDEEAKEEEMMEEEEERDGEKARQQVELDAALEFGIQVVQREARALALAAHRLASLGPQQDGFKKAVELVLRATNGERGGKIVFTGVGKSGIIGKKLCATFLSLGTASMFLHPVEALHGDLGLLTPHRDVVVALSHSGSSPEVLALMPHLRARKCPVIALSGRRQSALAKCADAWIDCGTGKGELFPHENAAQAPGQGVGVGVEAQGTTEEAWDEVPAPSNSTTVALALGDALAFAITRAKGLGREMFAFNHPGGNLGVVLATSHNAG